MAKDEMTPIRCKIVQAMADCNLCVIKAARALYMDHSTIHYHIKLIKAITGKDPRKFHDLCQLLQMMKDRTEKYWVYD